MSSDSEDDFQLSASDDNGGDSGSDFDEFAYEDAPVAKVRCLFRCCCSLFFFTHIPLLET